MESQQESRQHSALAFLFLLFSPYRISYTRYLCDSSHRLAGGFSPRSSLLTVARNLWPLSSAFSVSFFCSQPFSTPPHPSSICLDRDSERLSLGSNQSQTLHCTVPALLSRLITCGHCEAVRHPQRGSPQSLCSGCFHCTYQ